MTFMKYPLPYGIYFILKIILFVKVKSDQDPHWFGFRDPDQHWFGSLDSDQHSFGSLDPDQHSFGSLDPDPH
jgi:hypothetical protein